MSPIQHIHDLVCPDDTQGRTYAEINLEKTHRIEIGTLVELESGVRLFVVSHKRDCDETPLYYLSHDKDDVEQQTISFCNKSWIGGYPEHSLTVIQRPNPRCDTNAEYFAWLWRRREEFEGDRK